MKPMTFTLYRTSDYDFREKITLTMDELPTLYKRYGYPLIIDFSEMSIEIYDDYRE